MVSKSCTTVASQICNIACIIGYLLFYLCDTEEGSSGAPLVKTTNNGHRSVIALHRGWQKLEGNTYNCGTMMSTIVDHIQGEQPSYCE